VSDDPPPVAIRRATSADAEQAADVLADAFDGNEWTTWTIDGRDHHSRIRALQLLAIEHIGLPFGEVWIACDRPDGPVVGVAVWNDSRALAGIDLSRVDAEVARLEGDRHAAALEAAARGAAVRPVDDHLYLGTIGVAPGARRRGVGRALLEPLVAEADRTSRPVVLETSAPANLAFYRPRGFAPIHDQVLPDGGPHLWTLRRDPRPA
jgi:ribosomal protein S18 acetylase RimI-like enzyme